MFEKVANRESKASENESYNNCKCKLPFHDSYRVCHDLLIKAIGRHKAVCRETQKRACRNLHVQGSRFLIEPCKPDEPTA